MSRQKSTHELTFMHHSDNDLIWANLVVIKNWCQIYLANAATSYILTSILNARGSNCFLLHHSPEMTDAVTALHLHHMPRIDTLVLFHIGHLISAVLRSIPHATLFRPISIRSICAILFEVWHETVIYFSSRIQKNQHLVNLLSYV